MCCRRGRIAILNEEALVVLTGTQNFPEASLTMWPKKLES